MAEGGNVSDEVNAPATAHMQKAILDTLGKLIHLQKVALMGPERIFTFAYDDKLVQMYLPFAEDDFVQRNILFRGSFYEEPLLKKLQSMALFDHSGHVFDIGANIGNHTVFFSKILGAKRVDAFEPQNIAGGILQRNIELNELGDKVVPVKQLIGSKDGTGSLIAHFGNKNLGATAFNEAEEGDFRMTSIDGYCKKNKITKLDFMKIDVEGMQVPLIEGADEVLGDLKPALWMELRDFKDEYTVAAEMLERYAYKPIKLGPHDYCFTVQ